MNVLVTGAAGFIGKNLVERLKSGECPEVDRVIEFTLADDAAALEEYCAQSDFVFHLAGVNRPIDPSEFVTGNTDLTTALIDAMKRHRPLPVVLSSSTQAELENPYGKSKRAAEEALLAYGRETGAASCVYRLPGVFGKWSQPNYNSVVATFCHNIASGLPIRVDDPNSPLTLVYIDDVVDEFLRAMRGTPTDGVNGRYVVPVTYSTTVGELAERLAVFHTMREQLAVPDTSDEFGNKLHATYLSYLPPEGFSQRLDMKLDDRGSFTEIVRTPDRGQFSVNVIKPGIVKGNHWHNTKHEKFAVVSGAGVIRLRKVGDDAVVEYRVSGERIEVVDIPPGYTHNIENLGDTQMVVFMWANECFDPGRPDTYWLEVHEVPE